MSKTQSIIDLDRRVSAENYHPLPIVITEGRGSWVTDVEGKRYLDCLSAYSALNHGHGHPRLLKKLTEQASRLTLSSRAFHNDQMGAFLEKLLAVTGAERALPMNTGAEAVETAIKAARKWGYRVKGIDENQAEIIVCAENFHGRTTTIVSFSTEDQYRRDFGPFTPGFKSIPFGDLAALEKAITKNTVAFLIEPVQGEAGVRIPPAGFLSQAFALCRKNRVLLLADEIQSGLGRTGKLFAYQHEAGVEPDLLILGKALGGGVYPVSAVVGRDEVLGLFKPGDHGSTFGGNPLGSAVGLEALRVLEEEKLVENSARLGAKLEAGLEALASPLVEAIRVRGLWAGVDLRASAGTARAHCLKLVDHGILAKDTHGQTIRIAPPLVMTDAEMDILLAGLKRVLTASA